jgi:hypothetical protein
MEIQSSSAFAAVECGALWVPLVEDFLSKRLPET